MPPVCFGDQSLPLQPLILSMLVAGMCAYNAKTLGKDRRCFRRMFEAFSFIAIRGVAKRVAALVPS